MQNSIPELHQIGASFKLVNSFSSLLSLCNTILSFFLREIYIYI
ncbi:hypothetical protein VPHK404_0017 [Vibrio phage K404]